MARGRFTRAQHDELMTRLRRAAAGHGLTAHSSMGRHGCHVWLCCGKKQVLAYWPRKGTVFIPSTRQRQHWPYLSDAVGLVQLAAGLANGATVDAEAVPELAAA